MTRPGQPPRIGVLGGTFDPVHNGHLYVANALREALDLERILWIPAGRPPHKTGQIVSSDRDRLAMLDLALSGSAADQINTIDIERSGPSYTADTLEILAACLAPARLFFLMGEDSLRDLPTWHDPERLLRAAELAVAARPGVDADLASIARQIPSVLSRVHLVPSEEIAISSSEIRQRVGEHRSIHGLVPAPVEAYIRDHGLYTRQAP
ncbi:MAG TPA: nicotinate-nucleotide adenylyltransferase [Thermomicrobiales bacterium]|nr:nicotinate-nucleotide adenylyltransferase [Thermomicrobiales bacterium]